MGKCTYLFVDETVEVQLLYELPVLRQQEPRSDLYNETYPGKINKVYQV